MRAKKRRKSGWVAAYPEEPVGEEFFDRVLSTSKDYSAVSVRSEAGEVIGFGFL